MSINRLVFLILLFFISVMFGYHLAEVWLASTGVRNVEFFVDDYRLVGKVISYDWCGYSVRTPNYVYECVKNIKDLPYGH
jgi:hypothetical protein